MNKNELQFLLQKYNVRPRKEQGQNFVIDPSAINAMIAAADLTPHDVILEIGAGFGVLTTALAAQAAQVVAVEQDQQIFPAILALAKQHHNIQPINADIRAVNLRALNLRSCQYKLVANLPYVISSWVLRCFLEQEPKPSVLVVMLQKEVAERVVAKPGNMSTLANAVQCFGHAFITQYVPASSFWPAPQVDSAILKITLKDKPLSPEPAALLRLVRIGFSAKRKQLHNNLAAGLARHVPPATAKILPEIIKKIFQTLDLRENCRAQELTVEKWEQLRCQLKEYMVR